MNVSNGVNMSDGVNRSYGILNCYGVDHALFLADKPKTFSIFGVEVTEERFSAVKEQLFSKLCGWFPKFNNAFALYDAAGKVWSKVDASDIGPTLDNWEDPYEAWKDIPVAALEYIRSLPEFDAVMFERITGIKPETKPETIRIGDYEYNKADVESRLKGIRPIA